MHLVSDSAVLVSGFSRSGFRIMVWFSESVGLISDSAVLVSGSVVLVSESWSGFRISRSDF